MMVLLLAIGTLSAVSFAKPDKYLDPPREAKFFVIDDNSSQANPHPHPAAVLLGNNSQKSIIVHRGQTLSSIAARVLGSPKRWPILWWDNKRKVPNPNMLRVGTRLYYGTWNHVKPWLQDRAMEAIPKPPPPPPTPIAAPSSSTPQPVASTPVSSTSYSGAPGSFQACVIASESGGDPSIVNPTSGAGGLYQFLPSTWAALGFPGLPQDASVAMQNAAFAKAYAKSGTSPWRPYDGC